jgi:hypothetical protein
LRSGIGDQQSRLSSETYQPGQPISRQPLRKSYLLQIKVLVRFLRSPLTSYDTPTQLQAIRSIPIRPLNIKPYLQLTKESISPILFELPDFNHHSNSNKSTDQPIDQNWNPENPTKPHQLTTSYLNIYGLNDQTVRFS